MNENTVALSLDLRKNRIRFHKSMLHLLGDPPYVQLLIDPDTMLVAVKALSRATAGDQSHKVSKKSLLSDNSVEIYSLSLVSRIAEILGLGNNACTYRIDGQLVPTENAAVFDLKNIIKNGRIPNDETEH